MLKKKYYFNPKTGKFVRPLRWVRGRSPSTLKYVLPSYEGRIRELEDYCHNLNDQLKALADHVGLEVEKRG